MTKAQDHAEIRHVFLGLDTSGNGFLSLDELERGLADVAQIFAADESSVREMFKAADVNADGEIDYSEFVTASFKRDLLLSRENLRKAFNYLDANADGRISKEDLRAALGGGHVAAKDARVWDTIIEQVDENNDQHISFEEFEAAMTKVIDERAQAQTRRLTTTQPPAGG